MQNWKGGEREGESERKRKRGMERELYIYLVVYSPMISLNFMHDQSVISDSKTNVLFSLLFEQRW